MSSRRGLVLDADILLRGVFGQRVRQIIEKYEDEARFYTPDVCFEDARRYIPALSNQRRFDADLGPTLNCVTMLTIVTLLAGERV